MITLVMSMLIMVNMVSMTIVNVVVVVLLEIICHRPCTCSRPRACPRPRHDYYADDLVDVANFGSKPTHEVAKYAHLWLQAFLFEQFHEGSNGTDVKCVSAVINDHLNSNQSSCVVEFTRL
jgi:hypothetical protein